MLLVCMLDIVRGLRQCVVLCGFIFPYKQSLPQQFCTHSLGMVLVASFIFKKERKEKEKSQGRLAVCLTKLDGLNESIQVESMFVFAVSLCVRAFEEATPGLLLGWKGRSKVI